MLFNKLEKEIYSDEQMCSISKISFPEKEGPNGYFQGCKLDAVFNKHIYFCFE